MPPVWALALEMSGGDPLRAMEIESGLSQEWYERWLVWHNERAAKAKKDSEK